MREITKGGNIAIEASSVELQVQIGQGAADVSAYLLDGTGRVRGDDDMLFYNQPQTPNGAIRLDGRVFRMDLTRIDPQIERIAICITPENGTVAQLGSVGVSIPGVATFREDARSMSEAAIILGEVYLRNGSWKFRAVAQGFNGGLAPLSRHFGVEVEGGSDGATRAPSPAGDIAAVSLKKVTLEKAGKVDLRKGAGAVKALLQWDGRGRGEGDLDLYCFYVLKDGTCGKVYWKDMGRSHAAPWITLSGDSQNAGEEEIVLHRPDELKYALFAAYSAVGNGAGSFESYRPRMILTDQEGSEVTIPLLNPNSTSYWVAISHLSVGRSITIEHVETYGKSGVRAWIAAERSPRLHADGSWDISKGPVEFKRN